jgi:transglutaminase-like putative cysteine protease
VVEIRGSGFGDLQGDGRVTVAGVRPTGSSYLSWSDSVIRVRVPETADSGLVSVTTRKGRSNSLLFTNRDELPVLVSEGAGVAGPFVSSLRPQESAVGGLVTVSGGNFGLTRDESQVLFAAAADPEDRLTRESGASARIAAADSPPELELWSDSEIRVRVPDGAVSGELAVKSSRGLSAPVYLEIGSPAGSKTYRNRKTYVIRYSVEIKNVKASGPSDLFLWVPRPAESDSQRGVSVINVSRQPEILDYSGAMLHHLSGVSGTKPILVSHDFSLDAYETRTVAKPESIKPPPKDSPYLALYARPEPAVPSDAKAVAEAAAAIFGKEKNPWRQARLAYDWVGARIRLERTDDRSTALSALSARRADAYGMAMLYVALLRYAGIPARPVAGVSVDAARTARTHYWAEFRIEGIGWVPADPAFGYGPGGEAAPSAPAREGMNATDFYFGNVDNDRIAFSRGTLSLSPQLPGSRTQAPPRGYSLHGVREEASASIQSYSSFWSDISIVGIY